MKFEESDLVRGFYYRDGENIIARIFLMRPLHVEGIFIEPEKRSGLIAKQLMNQAETRAKQMGVDRLFAYAVSEEIEGYLERLGYKKQPFTVWAKELT